MKTEADIQRAMRHLKEAVDTAVMVAAHSAAAGDHAKSQRVIDQTAQLYAVHDFARWLLDEPSKFSQVYEECCRYDRAIALLEALTPARPM